MPYEAIEALWLTIMFLEKSALVHFIVDQATISRFLAADVTMNSPSNRVGRLSALCMY